MITLNNEFSIKRDRYCWQLLQTVDTVNPKTKEPTKSTRTSYHPTLEKLVRKLIDIEAGDCDSLAEILELLQTVPSEVAQCIEVEL